MTVNYADISIVIPAYNPDHKLIDLVQSLMKDPYKEIIIVNDGSKDVCRPIFDELEKKSSCKVLHHEQNAGKGRALKTAFAYYTEKHPNGLGVVTADADGQHSPEDIKKVAEALIEEPEKLILGTRDFSGEDIPFRSRFGNNMTKVVTKISAGMKVSDTQTGLRGISRTFAKELLDVSGERYEFEMRMILACKTYNHEISEVKIDTIYIDDNESSHFNPIIDSIKIYYVFLRFLVSSVASFLLDVGLFALFSAVLQPIFPVSFIVIATIAARILSSLFNYFVNRNVVFKSYHYTRRTLAKYYILAVLILASSSAGVHYIYEAIGNHEVIIKVCVDSVLFLASFYIQRKWVFNQDSQKQEVSYG